MKHKETPSAGASGALLGIECGGTKTVALLVSEGNAPAIARLGPANLRLLSDAELVARFGEVRAALGGGGLAGMAIGMAGARTEDDRKRICQAAAQIWPGVPCYASNDLETATIAASVEQASCLFPGKGETKGSGFSPLPGNRQDACSTPAQVLILSGTGSCCFGRDEAGRMVRFGGWGHILGDAGSGYDAGLRALRAVIYELDVSGQWPPLGRRILQVLELNEPTDLIDWARHADKTRVAALAFTVFGAAEEGDEIAARILADAAASLARDGVHCARRIVKQGNPVEFVFVGGLLKNQAGFAKSVGAHLVKLWPGASVKTLERETVWGAIELARLHFGAGAPIESISQADAGGAEAIAIPAPLQMSPTEERNPYSVNLDKLTVGEAIELFASEDASIPHAVLGEASQIERAVKLVVRAFKSGGRLFYAGAGSSGRLGVLDASEIPPTFRADPAMVQGIIAGGREALWRSIEGAEDDPAAGAASVKFRGVTARDVVMGIAASGRTPFVWGALDAARKIGSVTILLCFNPHLRFAPGARPKVVIAPNVGPEILTGSTRLKAGTATKMVLNMITTIAMVRLGKVRSNLMIDLNPSNTKLRDRAVRIVQAITGVPPAEARQVLESCGWNVKTACSANPKGSQR